MVVNRERLDARAMAELWATSPATFDYIAGRRERGIPADGLPWDEWLTLRGAR